ncbi:hypothetical protein CDAR_448191 [Caerostris darwini]|uniref:Uncharacterized protein n=1 Tax=Caerostris darwini TaxID=1538125 RepID=A0AAV4SJG9_9ARAC|nr:hypothetical protein CDAR_448191 [Caerostris darwini]
MSEKYLPWIERTEQKDIEKHFMIVFQNNFNTVFFKKFPKKPKASCYRKDRQKLTNKNTQRNKRLFQNFSSSFRLPIDCPNSTPEAFSTNCHSPKSFSVVNIVVCFYYTPFVLRMTASKRKCSNKEGKGHYLPIKPDNRLLEFFK